MKFKIIGAIFVVSGLLLIAMLDQHLIGLLLMFIGFYLAMKKGMKPV